MVLWTSERGGPAPTADNFTSTSAPWVATMVNLTRAVRGSTRAGSTGRTATAKVRRWASPNVASWAGVNKFGSSSVNGSRSMAARKYSTAESRCPARVRQAPRYLYASTRCFCVTSNGQLGETIKRSEEHTSELQSPCNLVCRLLLEKKKKTIYKQTMRCIECA